MHCVLLVVEREMVKNASVIKVGAMCVGVICILHEVFKRRAGLDYIYIYIYIYGFGLLLYS